MTDEKTTGRTKISMWIDDELLEGIDEKAQWAQRSRSSWVQIELARLIGVKRLLPEYGAPKESDEKQTEGQ